MVPQIKKGFVLGTGSAITIELGFIPDFVWVFNAEAATEINYWWLRQRMCAFTSGGTHEIVAGDILQGATNTNVRAKVEQVLLESGTWAGGDAAGWLLWHEDNENGTFGSENVDLLDDAATVALGGGIDDDNVAAVSAQSEKLNYDLDTEMALVTGNATITPYKGVAGSNARGFTIGSTISVSGEVLGYLAIGGIDTNRTDVA